MKKWKKKVLAATAAFLTAVLTVVSVSAASVDLNGVYSISINDIPGWPAGPEISSSTGVLMEASTGTLVYSKGGDELRYPASITKLMTLLVAVENCDLDETVTFTETGIRDIAPDSANIGMQLGETMSMEDCLYALIIRSANEVAAQVAEYVGGTEQSFIDMMNARAEKIGCVNTHFTNANGLPDENHYTTAKDMALIFRECLKNKTCRKILKTSTYYIEPTNMNGEQRKLHTHHPLLAKESPLYYEGCIGGKTGMTIDAGHTLVTGVKKDGVTYIAVVMRAADLNQACLDSRLLFDYGYANFQKTEYKNGTVIIPANTDVSTLTSQEENVNGKNMECYYLSGYQVGTGSVSVPTPTVEVVEEAADGDAEPLYTETEATEKKTDSPSNEKGLSDLSKILLAVMGAMVVLLVVLLIALAIKNKKHENKHKK